MFTAVKVRQMTKQPIEAVIAAILKRLELQDHITLTKLVVAAPNSEQTPRDQPLYRVMDIDRPLWILGYKSAHTLNDSHQTDPLTQNADLVLTVRIPQSSNDDVLQVSVLTNRWQPEGNIFDLSMDDICC